LGKELGDRGLKEKEVGSRSLRGRELKGRWKCWDGEVRKQKPGVAAWGPAMAPELEEEQGYGVGSREDSKSQLEGVWVFSFCLFFP
jgi:hypothetical protein